MATPHKVSRTTSEILAPILLLPPLVFFIIWIRVGSKSAGISAADQMNIYLGYFPSWLRNAHTIFAISIVCCIAVIALGARGFNKKTLSIRLLMFIIVLIAVLILLFDIYQLV